VVTTCRGGRAALRAAPEGRKGRRAAGDGRTFACMAGATSPRHTRNEARPFELAALGCMAGATMYSVRPPIPSG
jgi:hypothetical protein